MEDNPTFNAGTGSVLTIDGNCEMDASVMTHLGEFGAVGCIKDVKNPIYVARKVMEETDHLLLVGSGAEKFARRMGFEKYNPITETQKERLLKLKANPESEYFPKLKKYLDLGTVGAVAFDNKNRIAVANSTGGIRGKLPGRVGDSAILGAGAYASLLGGAVATGHGEMIMKLLLSKMTVDSMKLYEAQIAIDIMIKEARKNNCTCGIIGIDAKGNLGFGKTAEVLAWAYVRDGALISF